MARPQSNCPQLSEVNVRKKRIGKDLSIIWKVTTNGLETPLEGRDIRLELTDPRGQKIELPITVDGITIRAKYYGKDQTVLGQYKATVWENYGKEGQTVVDTDAFALVPETKMEG